MEQGTENTTPVDAGVTQESGEITEVQLREMLAEMDGIKLPKVEEATQEAKPEEPKKEPGGEEASKPRPKLAGNTPAKAPTCSNLI